MILGLPSETAEEGFEGWDLWIRDDLYFSSSLAEEKSSLVLEIYALWCSKKGRPRENYFDQG